MAADSTAGNGPAVKEQRYVGLDALRGFMMMLGIVLHASLLYLQAPPPAMPVPTDRNNSYAFDLIFDRSEASCRERVYSSV